MRVLCICNGGNVRSVAMAQHLKEQGHDAIAVGLDHASPETLDMLKNWAELEINMNDYFRDWWHDPRHRVLLEEVKRIWKDINDSR